MNIILSVSSPNRQVTVRIKANSKDELSPLIQNIPALVFLSMMERTVIPQEEFEQVQEESKIGFELGENDEKERETQKKS